MLGNVFKKISQSFGGAMTLLLLNFSLLHSQSTATFEATGPGREVPEGNRFEVSFTLKNVSGKRFIPPDFSGFRVTGGPSEMRGAGFINGQSYSHQTWSYELEAGKPGTYTIGPAIVQTASQTLRTLPITIRVVAARASRANVPPKSDDRLFVSGELDHDRAWVGQQVHYQIKLYTQVGISDFDILELPPFDGFFTRECKRFDTRTQYQTLRGKKYAVRILYEMALFPQESGEISIGPARVRLGVDQGGSSFSALLGSIPVMMQTQTTKLKVLPLPEPAPVQFTGGVGRYEWEIRQDKDAITTDDALTLSVTIQGNGDAKRFASPRFLLPDGLDSFDPKAGEEEEFETGDQFMHTRKLEYVILPKQPGVYQFVPEMAVFDPDSNRYRMLKARAAVRVEVTAGKNYGQPTAPVDTLSEAPPPPSPLALFWGKTVSWLGSPRLWGGVGVVALLIGLVFFWKKYRRARSAAPQPVMPAPGHVRPGLKEVQRQFDKLYRRIPDEDAKTFYRDLLKVLETYLEVWLDLGPAQMNKETLAEKLAARQVPEQTTDALLALWQNCEQAVFGGQARDSEKANAWYQAQAVFQQLEALRKRG